MKTFTQLMLTICFGVFISGSSFAQQPKIKLLGQVNLGGSSTDLWSWVDPQTQKEYVAAGVGSNLHIVDVSNPTNPVKVSSIGSVPVFDEKVWINPADKKVYVYTVSGGGNQRGGIVDVTNPASPQKVGDFPGAHNVMIDQEKGLLILAIPGFRIFDIKSSPTSPQQLFSTPGDGHDVNVVGDVLYNFNGRDGTDLWNISDPRSPRKMGGHKGANIKYSHHGMPSKVVGEGQQYLYVCDELSTGSSDDISVLNISDPTDINKVSGYGRSATVHNLYVIGDYAYTSYYQDGFVILDVSDPSKMVFVDQHDCASGSGQSMGGNFGICPFGTNNKMFSNSDGKVFVYDVSEFAVGVKDNKSLENISMELYPNPNNGTFFVDIKGNITSDLSPRLKITNLEGKIVKDERLGSTGVTNKKVSLADYSKGVYFVQLQTNEGNINKKIVIR